MPTASAMDSYEASRIVFSRIQNLDPENASKVMGLLLFQDHAEKEMIRLAFGPEVLVLSAILKARKELGLPSNYPPAPSSPSSFLPSQQVAASGQSSSYSRINGISIPALTVPNPSSPTSAAWSTSSELQNPDGLMSPRDIVVGNSTPSANSSALPFFDLEETDAMDGFQLQDQLSFLDDGAPPLAPQNPDLFHPKSSLSASPTGADDHMLFPPYPCGGGSIHGRSCSADDVCLASEDSTSGLGWKPCLYFARGYCKNGASCRFLHGMNGDVEAASMAGSPNCLEMMEQCHELLRSKPAHQPRLTPTSQIMSASSLPYSPKCMSLPKQQDDPQRYQLFHQLLPNCFIFLVFTPSSTAELQLLWQTGISSNSDAPGWKETIFP